ncbi:MAG: N-acetyltransferase family protein [Candidatus Sericytochromatia bacterium]
MSPMIRRATASDIPLILELIRELADYEKEPEAAVATAEDLRRDGFGEQPYFHVLIAETTHLGKEGPEIVPAGFAFYFFNYSTWQGKPGLYLEDLFVRPAYRGLGLGKALLRELACIAIDRNCGRMQWAVLDWNQPAIDFYKSLGVSILKEWLPCRLSDGEIARLARS